MSNNTIERNMRMRKRQKKYKRRIALINTFWTIVIIVCTLFCALHVFTHKKQYRNKGVEAYGGGDYEAAIQYLDMALDEKQWFSEKQDVDISMYLAAAYIGLKDYDAATEVYDSVIKNYREYDADEVSFMIRLMTALKRFDSGDYVSSVAALNEAVERGYTDMAYYAAGCYESQKNYDAMKKYYDIYAEKYGMNSFLYYKDSIYYIAMNDYGTALSCIEKGINMDEGGEYRKKLFYAEILCHEKLGNYEKAYSLAGRYVQAYPDDEDGKKLYEYLDTRINIDETSVNGFYDN